MTTAEPYREAIDFLSDDPKNLELAFDLIKVFPNLLDRFHAKFWDTLKVVIETELDRLEITDWVVDLDGAGSEDFIKPRKKNDSWLYLSINPKNAGNMPLYYAFFIEQSFEMSKVFPDLYYGYGFSAGLDRIQQAKLSQLTKLPLEEQKEQEWLKYPRQLEDGGWLACKQLPYALRGRDETILLAKGNSLETEIAEALLDLFKQKRQEAEKINAALRQH